MLPQFVDLSEKGPKAIIEKLRKITSDNFFSSKQNRYILLLKRNASNDSKH